MNERLRRRAIVFGAAGLLLGSNACALGPAYQRPDLRAPQTFKEAPPAGWKAAQPSDDALRGNWWERFGNPDLNALERAVTISNQNVLTAEAQFREAQAAVRIAGASRFPTVTASLSASNAVTGAAARAQPLYTVPVDVAYEVDVWGGIRSSVTANRAAAQASEAELENARLLYEADLAADYFQLQGLDASRRLLEDAVTSYERYVQLTQDRYQGGVASMGDVALAQTQLETARAQLVDLGVQRAQFEHAIAVLTGKPPADVSILAASAPSPPPAVPMAVPSALLERRPDVAAAERQVAAANAQIGVAKAALYPVLTFDAGGGSRVAAVADLLTLPGRFWSVGAELAGTLFDAGKRHAQIRLTQAAYDATVANYRQTVLTGFQQVEDSLAALRVLSDEAEVVDRAVDAAKRSLDISTAQYRGGLTNYLQVITAQTSVLQNQRAAVEILTRRLVASVSLIQALGGGWDASQLSSSKD